MPYSATQAPVAEAYIEHMRDLCSQAGDLTATAFRSKVTAATSGLAADLAKAGAYTRGAHDLADDISDAMGAPRPHYPDSTPAPRRAIAPSPRTSSAVALRTAAPDYTSPSQNPLAHLLQRF